MLGSKKSIQITLAIISIMAAFHLCIITKLIPYNITWGGRLKNDQEMYVFEIISIMINLFLIAILLMKGKYLKVQFNEKVINIILWIFFFIFILNTIGNLLAKTTFENIFTAITLILAILLWNILNKKPANN